MITKTFSGIQLIRVVRVNVGSVLVAINSARWVDGSVMHVTNFPFLNDRYHL